MVVSLQKIWKLIVKNSLRLVELTLQNKLQHLKNESTHR